MKKVIILLSVMFLAIVAKAEDVLQATPFATTAGVTSNDAKYFSIEMNNSSAEIWALEFEMVLPSGMTLDSTGGLNPFELVAERCPYKVGRGGAITWNHQVICTEISENKYYITVTTVEADRFNGNTGELLRAYYLTDDNMQSGIYPIHIKGTVMAIDGNDDIKPVESSSYVVIGDSPLKTEAIPDLSSLTGYIPSWVINNINSEINSNSAFVGLNLSGATSFGSTIETANKNALFYVNTEADVTDVFTNGNVVRTGDNNYSCPSLTLTDGEYNFHALYNMQGGSVKYDLLLESNVYTTLCLPFALSDEQVAKLKDKSVTIEKLSAYDVNKAELTFTEVYSTEANMPYLIKCNDSYAPFVELTINEIVSSSQMNDVTANNVKMEGVFCTEEPTSDETHKIYVFDGATDRFIPAENGEKVSPFRAYIKVPAENAPSSLGIFHYNDEFVGINDVHIKETKGQCIYDVLGRKVSDNATSTKDLDAGIYIINGKKVLVK